MSRGDGGGEEQGGGRRDAFVGRKRAREGARASKSERGLHLGREKKKKKGRGPSQANPNEKRKIRAKLFGSVVANNKQNGPIIACMI